MIPLPFNRKKKNLCHTKKKKKNLTLFSNKNDLILCKILSYMPSLLLNLPYMWFSFITYNLILTHGYFLLVAYNHISIALSHLDLNLSLSLSLSHSCYCH